MDVEITPAIEERLHVEKVSKTRSLETRKMVKEKLNAPLERLPTLNAERFHAASLQGSGKPDSGRQSPITKIWQFIGGSCASPQAQSPEVNGDICSTDGPILLHKSEVLFATSSSQQDSTCKFGFTLSTFNDGQYIRHRISYVQHKGIADEIGLRVDDEFLILQDTTVFNMSHDEVLKIFAEMTTSQEVSMIIRHRASTMTASDGSSIYEYVHIKATLVIVGHGLAEEIMITAQTTDLVDSPKEYPYSYIHFEETVPFRVAINNNIDYLRVLNGVLAPSSDGLQDDPSSVIDVLNYIAYEKSGKPVYLWVLRVSNGKRPLYLNATSASAVEMTKYVSKNSLHAEPETPKPSALFKGEPVFSQHTLQSVKYPGRYLAVKEGNLVLEQASGSIHHHDSIKFYMYMLPRRPSIENNSTHVIVGPSKMRHTIHFMGNSSSNTSLNESGGKLNGHEEL